MSEMGFSQQWRLLSRVNNISWICAVTPFLEGHRHYLWTTRYNLRHQVKHLRPEISTNAGMMISTNPLLRNAPLSIRYEIKGGLIFELLIFAFSIWLDRTCQSHPIEI
jgi:hypothetical protein